MVRELTQQAQARRRGLIYFRNVTEIIAVMKKSFPWTSHPEMCGIGQSPRDARDFHFHVVWTTRPSVVDLLPT